MRRGVRLGVDVGDVRIGVAASDPSGLIATPVETVARGQGDLARLRALAEEHEALEVVVGLPRSLSGREGPAAAKVRAFATELADVLAADGREVGESRAGAEHDHRVTPERQQILRGALLPAMWCHAGQHEFVAAVLRRRI